MHKNSNVVFFCILSVILLFAGCRKGESDIGSEDIPEEQLLVVKNDSMMYGLTCEGSSDSVVVLWPFYGEPITFSCIDAKNAGRVIGKPEIGDWIGVMLNPEDSTEASMVINLDELKGTWAYPVMPVMKDLEHMSKRMQRRMLANIPDSIKETFLVPKDYGFILKRNHKAQPLEWNMRTAMQEDDSPVKYPDVKIYRQWHMCNGRLLLVSLRKWKPEDGKPMQQPDIVDTLDFVFMGGDSLVLSQNGTTYHFHRKRNRMKSTNVAKAAMAKQSDAMGR